MVGDIMDLILGGRKTRRTGNFPLLRTVLTGSGTIVPIKKKTPLSGWIRIWLKARILPSPMIIMEAMLAYQDL